MRATTLLVVVLTAVALVAGCGGRQAPGANPSMELDKRHCTSGADCASGFCGANGRCG